MKNKGVIIAIALIIITGAAVTVGTRRFINDKTGDTVTVVQGQSPSAAETGLESQSVSAAGLGPAPFSESPEGGRKTGSGPEGYAPGTEGGREYPGSPVDSPLEAAAAGAAAETQEGIPGDDASLQAAASDQQETAGIVAEKLSSRENTEVVLNSTVSISPLTGADQSLEAVAEAAVTLQGFRKKLSEIDILVQNMQESDAGSNTDSLKKVADYEYRLWDSELNLIYKSILEGMTSEEAENLKTEERKWIRTRDSAAKKAAARFKGGTMESLEYTASLADSTRSRAYELLDNYGQYLKQEED